MVRIIQANYSQLGAAIRQLQRHTSDVLDLYRQAKHTADDLLAGGWIGEGAARFGEEIETLVFPAVQRLIMSLQGAGQYLERSIGIFQAAESEAGQLFRGESNSEIIAYAVRIKDEVEEELKLHGWVFDTEEHAYKAIESVYADDGPNKLDWQVSIDSIDIAGNPVGFYEGVVWSGDHMAASAAWPEDMIAKLKAVINDAPQALKDNSVITAIYWGGGAAVWREDSGLKTAPGVFLPTGDKSPVYGPGSMIISSGMQNAVRYGGDEQNRIEAALLHEFAHTAQFNSDGTYSYLMDSYLFEFEWTKDPLTKTWTYNGNPDDLPGGNDQSTWYPHLDQTNPMEDMAEAIAFYRYNPEVLYRYSRARYDWVRDNIYEGKEFR